MSLSFDNKLEPFKVPSSLMTATSFMATGASLTGVTVIFTIALVHNEGVPLSQT